MATLYDCSVPAELLTGMRLARGAIGRGELVVIPTDTVYGIAADAFSPAAVKRLLEAKGRGPPAPPPVLIPGIPTLEALAETVPDEVRALGGRSSGPAVSRSSCARDPPWTGTSARRAAPSRCACRRQGRPRTARRDRTARGLEREPARANRPRPRRPRPSGCSATRSPSTSTAGLPAPATPTPPDAWGRRSSTRRRSRTRSGKLRIVRHGVIPDAQIVGSSGPTDAHNLLPARRRASPPSSPSF